MMFLWRWAGCGTGAAQQMCFRTTNVTRPKMGYFEKEKHFRKPQTAYFSNLPLLLQNSPPLPQKQATRGAPSPLLLFAHARDLGFLASCARPGGLFVAFFRPWQLPGPRSQFLAPGQKKEKDAATGILEELAVLKKAVVLNWAFLGEFCFCRIVSALCGVIVGDSGANWWTSFAALGPGPRLWGSGRITGGSFAEELWSCGLNRSRIFGVN